MKILSQVISKISFVSKGVTEDHMDHLEDVLSPSLLNLLHIDEVCEGVVGGDVGVRHCDLARIVESMEVNHDIGKLRPLLELPLHHNFFVFDKLFVDTLNTAVEHLKFTLRL